MKQLFKIIQPKITHHPSLITHHPSLITHHPSPITNHPSPITHRKSQITQSLMTILLLCLLSFSSTAQTWNWGIKGGSSTAGQTGIENIMDMATDQNGNVYFLALVKGPGATLGNTNIPLTYYGGEDILLAKYDCEGNYKWHKSFGGWVDDKGVALGIDTLGGVYATGAAYSPGNTSTQVSFDTDTTLAYATMKTVFVVKYDTSGIFQWLSMPEPDTTASRNSFVSDLIVEPNGEFQCYIRSYGGLMASGNVTLPSSFGDYILKYDNQGNLISYIKFQTQLSFQTFFSTKIAQDSNNGNYYMAGQYIPFNTGSYLSMGGHEITSSMVVGAFDNQGQYLWHRTNTNEDAGFFGRPQIDNQGNITLLGMIVRASLPFQIPDTFNGYISTMVPGYYSQSPFVVQLSPTGTNNWALGSLTNSGLRFKGITILGNEIIAGGPLTGSSSLVGKFFWEGMTDTIKYAGNRLTLHRINASTGAFIDTFPSLDLHTEAPNTSEFSILTKDKNGNIYAGGEFNSQQFTFPNGTLMSEGPSDFFVARFGYGCNCDAPVANFSYTGSGNNSVAFTYTGTTPYTAISWDFGDGNGSANANPTHDYGATGSYHACVTVVNDCGTNTFCQTVNSNGVGIRETGLAAQIAIYPNPTSGTLRIKGLSGTTGYHLYNGVGQSLRQGTLHGSDTKLDISALAAGWYVLELQDEHGGKGRFKVVKE